MTLQLHTNFKKIFSLSGNSIAAIGIIIGTLSAVVLGIANLFVLSPPLHNMLDWILTKLVLIGFVITFIGMDKHFTLGIKAMYDDQEARKKEKTRKVRSIDDYKR